MHPRDGSGAETLAAEHVAAALRAVRTAVPAVEISLSTGEWIASDREALIAGWTELPDLVSLNLSERGWPGMALLLSERGIGIEAGLSSTADAEALVASPLRPVRVLVEIDDEALTGEEAVARATAIDEILDERAPRLHHGMGPATWAVIDAAVARGYDVRVGLEDVLVLPDGAPAPGNEALVAAARDRL
jgi:uncharacterized protein (DUF849 family)